LTSEECEAVQSLIDTVWRKKLGWTTISHLVRATLELGVDSVFQLLFPEDHVAVASIPLGEKLVLASALKRMLGTFTLIETFAMPAPVNEELVRRSAAEDRARKQNAVQQRLHLQCDPATIVVEVAPPSPPHLAPKAPRRTAPRSPASPPVRRLLLTFKCKCGTCKGKQKEFHITNNQARGVTNHYSAVAKRRRLSSSSATSGEEEVGDESEDGGDCQEDDDLAKEEQLSGEPF
jgi:hypothetical protein